MIKQYRDEKTGPPKGGFDPPAVETHYQKSREQRIYDPLLCKFRDASTEQSYKKLEQSALELSMLGQDVTIQRPFNIVNHKTKCRPKKTVTGTCAHSHHGSRSGYDIVSTKNLPGDTSNFTKTGTRSSNAWSTERKFSIINNKYKTGDERKQEIDKEATQQLLAARYWGSHNYNPVEGVFYNPSEEAAYWEAVEETGKNQGKGQKAKLPPSMQLAEGYQYDIIGLGKKDISTAPPVLANAMQTGQGFFSSMSDPNLRVKKYEQEDKWKRESFDNETGKEMRLSSRFNRTGNRTYLDTKAQGYNVISGVSTAATAT